MVGGITYCILPDQPVLHSLLELERVEDYYSTVHRALGRDTIVNHVGILPTAPHEKYC